VSSSITSVARIQAEIEIVIKGKSLLTEELHPDGQRKWMIMVVKPEPPTLVIARLSDISPICTTPLPQSS
jgi:hypothetical protein